MAQAQLSTPELEVDVAVNEPYKNRKITFNIDRSHYISVFKNENRETVINIRKGTRSVSISKTLWTEICDLKESVLLCVSVVEQE